MNLIVSVEPYTQWVQEAVSSKMFEAHWRECDTDHDKIPLAVNFEMYIVIEKRGLSVGYSLRDADTKELHGYALFLVAPHGHHKDHKIATCDQLYVTPEGRERGGGMKLIRFIEADLPRRDVAKIRHEAPAGSDLGTILAAIDYTQASTVWEKLLI